MRFRSALLCLVAVGAIAQAAPAPTSAPAPLDACTEVITFAVPGSTPDATSNAMVVVPHAYRDEPQSGDQTRRYPVVYLLHGFGGTHLRYHEKMHEFGKSLTDLADRFGTILVMPDGRRSSWYLDATSDAADNADWQIETRMIEHVVPEIDRRYRTWSDRTGRALTGMSMGGHGAFYLAARHPGVFAAVGSMSGVMDLRETLNPGPLAERIGSFEENRRRWTECSTIAQADRLVGKDVAILLDVGVDDPFIWGNRMLHDRLTRLKLAHDYIERPGKHEWKYWINALPYHLQFLTDRLKPAGTP